jgi:hypothetical protein
MLPRPVEVLHDGRWLAGSLVAVRREHDGGWRGLVSYTDRAAVVGALGSRDLLGLAGERTAPLAYYHWRPEGMLRRPVTTGGSG